MFKVDFFLLFEIVIRGMLVKRISCLKIIGKYDCVCTGEFFINKHIYSQIFFQKKSFPVIWYVAHLDLRIMI